MFERRRHEGSSEGVRQWGKGFEVFEGVLLGYGRDSGDGKIEVRTQYEPPSVYAKYAGDMLIQFCPACGEPVIITMEE